MSPEQVSARFGPISAKSDVYALGLMLYELLTGQLPYALPRDGAVEERCQVIAATMPPPLSQHDPAYGGELEAIVAAALAKQPAERPTVAVLRSRLERVLQPVPPDRDRPRPPTTQPDLDQSRVASPPAPVPPAPPTADMASGSGVVGVGRPGAERRQLTILFCDLVDSTQLAGHRDPEDWRELVRAYQQTCAEVIQHFDGSIAQWLGDGFLVYFGWPQAHEDDALRAVRTGLGLLEAMGPLNTRLAPAHGLRLALRVGVHTGLVVVGEMGGGGRQERLALGDTPHIASRLQGLATPDTIVISAATFHLVEGYVTVEDLGRQALKGVATPLQVYRVVGATAAQSRMEIAAATGLTPLVGRDADVALLRDRWAQSRDGQGQVVLLGGEAGIGKSRLVEALSAHVRGEGARRMLFRCSPYHTHSAFFPVIAHLQRLLHWHPDEAPEARVTTLEQALQPYGFALQDVIPLLAALLSVPLPERYPPLMLSPQQQKQQTQAALVAWLLAEAERQPVLVVWEDLHWVDPSSMDFLSVLIDQTPTAPLLTLLACRPEFVPPWPARSHVTQLTLPRFTRPQIEEMVRHTAGGKRLPAEVVQQIVAKTDGVPLFVEELTKTIMESGLLRETAESYELMGPLPVLAIPTTLQDALMARLDRLGTAKGLAQLGATLGRQFAYALLREVAQRDDATVQGELERLVEAELLYQRGQPPHATYRFKHALIQDAAYQSLLKSTRQQVHQRIAQVLEAQFPETAETQPELLAHHYTEAGCTEQAVGYWLRAGQHASARWAHVEAISHFTTGIELLTILPETPERTQQELSFLTGLCQQYFSQSRLERARELAAQCCTLAQRLQDVLLLQEAHMARGSTFLFLGEYVAARASLEQGMALYDSQQCRILTFSRRPDPGVACLARVALTLWFLGYAEQALVRSQEALALAKDRSHAYSLAFALHHAGALHQCRREVQVVQELAEAQMALSSAQGFPHWSAGGMMRHGWVLVQQGAVEAGITQLRQGVDAWLARGNNPGMTGALARLAEAYGKAGQPAAGLGVLAEALAAVHTTAEHLYEAELYRLKGELLLQFGACELGPEGCQAHMAEAEACYQQALDVARRQQAKSLELRAGMSLARLWQQQGQRAEARALLAPIYGWFTEGLDTADLQEAKTLLEELGR
jgi:class 3 adenylate cyclase/predicted ATPase